MKPWTLCTAIALLGLPAAPAALAEEPFDSIPPPVDQIEEACIKKHFRNDPRPNSTLEGFQPYDDLEGHDGWLVWVVEPDGTGSWWFLGFCDEPRNQLWNGCVIPAFRLGWPPQTADDSVQPHEDSNRVGWLVWVGGTSDGLGSWWFVGLCADGDSARRCVAEDPLACADRLGCVLPAVAACD